MTGDLHYPRRLCRPGRHQPGFWRDDYDSHGHWVPQFGVFALALASG
jgi:hypothetical protein